MPPLNPIRPRYWRSLAEAAQTPAYLAAAAGEFSAPAPDQDDAVSRRSFLKLIGASAAVAGLSACTREPIRQIVPYIAQPENMIPGKPLHYATAMPFGGFGIGLVVESHEGHPTKIEGNPAHPASLGATSIFQQAALLDLYDPDRAQSIRNAGEVSTFPLFMAAVNETLGPLRQRGGAGLRILTQSITSPTLIAQMEQLLRQLPEARWHQYQPLSRDNSLEGARLAFGRPTETHYHFERAKVILSLDADFLTTHPNSVGYIRQFSQGRRPSGPGLAMNRLYVAEPTPSITGSVADQRLPASTAEIEAIAAALAGENGALPEKHRQWVQALMQDIRQNPGKSLVIAGETQGPSIHALAHRLNEKFGNVGQSIEYSDSAETHWINHRESLAELIDDMRADKVQYLFILGGNPVFDAPDDLEFGPAMERVKFCVHLSTEQNETSVACQWHVPESHFLESWGDVRAFDGTTSIIQPLIAPMYESKTAHELLYFIMTQQIRDDYDIVRDHWQPHRTGGDFEKWWRQTLHDGVMADSRLAPITAQPNSAGALGPPAISGDTLEICFRPDPTIWDGRFANNGWLEELPKPFSKLTWDNPALISPALAKKYQLENGDMVELTHDQRVLTAAVWVMPGQAENSITVHLGLGRSHTGRTGTGAGFNSYVVRTSETQWSGTGLKIAKTNSTYPLSFTQQSHNIHGRDIVRSGTVAEYAANPNVTNEHYEPYPPGDDTLYDPAEFKSVDYAWGMAINLNACVGCNACILACQSENNIAVVGKQQVAAGRDMQWIRVDQYFEGDPEEPRMHHQPVPCMQCENAPCELVCPVGATLHDHQGLNLQVYNRCVGTRYCSNNCPYKVRRFNFYRYSDYETPSLKDMRNPNVTVRWRGVMEKCSYCLQRISAARIASQLEGRSIRDGEVKTACQQVCPAQAITFGDINNPNSAVSKLKASPLNYTMLGELNTRPRTTYLARLRNPNPQLETQS